MDKCRTTNNNTSHSPINKIIVHQTKTASKHTHERNKQQDMLQTAANIKHSQTTTTTQPQQQAATHTIKRRQKTARQHIHKSNRPPQNTR